MELLIDILFWLLRTAIYISLIAIVIYLLLPWIFRKFVAPHFNAAYKYNPNNFKKESIITEQENIPSIEINNDNGMFRISFGKARNIVDGTMWIRHKGKVFSNKKQLSKGTEELSLNSFQQEKGEDKLGSFDNTIMSFRLESEAVLVTARIKQYENFFIFDLEATDGLTETATAKYENLIMGFPSFYNESLNTKILTYGQNVFCPPSREFKATSAPVVFYDNHLNCFILCPLNKFINAASSKDKNGRINCGIQGEIKEIPKGFSQKYILFFGKGIRNSLEKVGEILLNYHDAERKDPYADIAVSHLSYWTDNGAYYYYRTEKDMNYEDTMVAVKDHIEKENIPIKSFNFDSWWYVKYLSPFKKVMSKIFKPLYRLLGGGLFGNTIRWEADPHAFSTGLKTFHDERFNYPIIAHSRRWDSRSPYLDKFEFETDGNHAVPLKRDFWDWMMKFSKERGIYIYEQDWMKNQMQSISILREDITAAGQWLNSMALAAAENDIDVFYCMQTPGILLHSIKHPNVTIARSSGDYNHRWPPQYRFVFMSQTNLLFNAIGINSHQDCIKTEYKFFGEHYPALMVLIETLSAGLVCPSDAIGHINWPLLNYSCRDDGLLFKPDRPICANDLMFTEHRKYYICDTYTQMENLRWNYTLIINLWPKQVKETYFSPYDLGYEENEYLFYDFTTQNLYKVDKYEQIHIGDLNRDEYRYYLFISLAKNDMALIGCPTKFVTVSKKQFPLVESTADALTFRIEDIEEADTEIYVFSEQKPSKILIKGMDDTEEDEVTGDWEYIGAKHLVIIHLHFATSEIKEITLYK